MSDKIIKKTHYIMENVDNDILSLTGVTSGLAILLLIRRQLCIGGGASAVLGVRPGSTL